MNRIDRPPRLMLAAAALLLAAGAWLWWQVGEAVLFGQLNGVLC